MKNIFILLTLALVFASCGKKETGDQAAQLNAGLYGGTWVNVDGATGEVNSLVFSGNTAHLEDLWPGLSLDTYNFILTPTSSTMFIANNSGTITTWTYSVSGNNMHLCMASDCADFTR